MYYLVELYTSKFSDSKNCENMALLSQFPPPPICTLPTVQGGFVVFSTSRDCEHAATAV